MYNSIVATLQNEREYWVLLLLRWELFKISFTLKFPSIVFVLICFKISNIFLMLETFIYQVFSSFARILQYIYPIFKVIWCTHHFPTHIPSSLNPDGNIFWLGMQPECCQLCVKTNLRKVRNKWKAKVTKDSFQDLGI